VGGGDDLLQARPIELAGGIERKFIEHQRSGIGCGDCRRLAASEREAIGELAEAAHGRFDANNPRAMTVARLIVCGYRNIAANELP
jgi:hypothetical protein